MYKYIITFVFSLCSLIAPSQDRIIDYRHIDLTAIPDEFIEAAKANLNICFISESHGRQVTQGGMDAIRRYSTAFYTKYAFAETASSGVLLLDEPGTYYPPTAGWEENARNYLDNHPECNVMIWVMSNSITGGETGSTGTNGYNNALNYINTLEDFIAEYGPGGTANRANPVTFVFTTPPVLARYPQDWSRTYDPFSISTFRADSLIKRHCMNNNRWLFDYYALSTHTPDGENFGPNNNFVYDPSKRTQDDGQYSLSDAGHTRDNFLINWVQENPDSENALMSADNICDDCEHSNGEQRTYPDNRLCDNARLQCVMKGKAAWWLWARLAGWDGNPGETIPVTSIEVSGTGGATTITIDNGTLQMLAAVLPANATNKSVTWTRTNGTGQANISSTGLLTAVANGTVTVRATAADGSGVYDDQVITISNQIDIVPVSSIEVSGTGGATTITTDNGTLQMLAAVLPANATNKSVTWSRTNGTGQANISSTGLLTAVANGTVTVRATAADGSGVYDDQVITISNQVVPVTSIEVSGTGGATTITTDNGTLQMLAAVLPVNATNKSVTWSRTNGSGQANISSTGLLTAVANGTVTVRATAADGSGVYDDQVITISNQIIPVTGIAISISGIGNEPYDTLQATATISPAGATNKTVTWSVIPGTGQASISADGLIKVIEGGTVTVKATANDGSGIFSTKVVDLEHPVILVENITIQVESGHTDANPGDTVYLTALVIPATASNPVVEWAVAKGSEVASVDPSGVVVALSAGEATIRARSVENPDIADSIEIRITEVVSVFNREPEDIMAYPNPVRHWLTVQTKNYNASTQITLTDISGRVLLTKKTSSPTTKVDFSGLKEGIYIILIQHPGQKVEALRIIHQF